jgi:hypothetical protein
MGLTRLLTFAAVTAMTLITRPAVANGTEVYVGKPVPSHVRLVDSSLINQDAPPRDWVALDAVADGSGGEVWLLKTVHETDAGGKPVWIVRSAMRAPAIPPGYRYAIAFCSKNGKLRNEVVAAVVQNAKEWHTQVHSAWHADIEKLRFTRLPPNGVRCYNTAFGAMHMHEKPHAAKPRS